MRGTWQCGVLAWLMLLPAVALTQEAGPGVSATQLSADAEAKRQLLSGQLRDALKAGDFPLAREKGTAYVQFLEQSLGPDSPGLVSPLANLAAAQLELGDNTGARQNLSRALGLLDRQTSDKPLVRARLLTLEGRALIRDHDPEQARISLRKAAAIVEANPDIDARTRAQVYEALLDAVMAGGGANVDRLVYEGNLVAKNEIAALEAQFGPDSANLAVALSGPAGWYRFSGQRDEERKLQQRAIRLIEKEGGPTDPRLGEPLRGLVSLCLRDHRDRGEADKALEQIRGLRDDGSATSAVARAEAAALRGDVELVFGEPANAEASYVEAWQIIARHSGLGAALADRYFGEPIRLFAEPGAPQIGAGTGSRLREMAGTVSIRFTITPQGTADNVEVTSATADTDWDSSVRGSAALIRYRPRLVGGKPVATPGMEIRWEFS